MNRGRHLYSEGRPLRWALAHILVLLYFCPGVSSFFLSSPNLSRRRLDVCQTSTHGVALVRISDAGLKRAARGSLEMQEASRQKSSSGHHRTTLSGCSVLFLSRPRSQGWPHHGLTFSIYLYPLSLSGYIFATKAHIDNRQKLVKQQNVLQMYPQHAELRPTSV